MKVSSERYFPHINNAVLGPFEPFISYEHWHRYCYAAPFVAGKTVLDIASGEGYGSAFLASGAAWVYGVDVSEEAVEHACQTYVRDNLRFLQGSAGAIPIEGRNCIDTVVSFETIEHLDAPTQESFAREVKRLLKPDGVLLISTPNRTVYSEAVNHQNPYHLREFTLDEFLQFLGGYFASVQMLSQRTYPASYIWNVGGPPTVLAECQIALDGDVFRPAQKDEKEVRYLIAVCSDRKPAAPGLDSLLIDLSEVAFRGAPGREQRHGSGLFVDSGQDFRAEEAVYQQVQYGPEFSTTFTLDPSVTTRRLRWDPLELRLCSLHLHRVTWRDAEGASHELDLHRVSGNGEHLTAGCFRFETVDPMVFLPITGLVASVTLEGDCVVEDESASLRRLEGLLVQRRDELRVSRQLPEERERRLHELEQASKKMEDARSGLQDSALFVDSGQDFRAEEAVYQQVQYGPEFSTTFTLDPSVTTRRLRWDPLELRLCTLRLRRVLWRDGGSATRELNLDLLSSNGACLAAGCFRFETIDPMVFLPIAGSVASVTLEGECMAGGEADTLRGLESLLSRQHGELHGLRLLIEERERQFRECERQLTDLRSICAELTVLLRSLQNSNRGLLSNWLRSALRYIPNSRRESSTKTAV
jgi:ubiquinone/menaquinone biosynthesis C-methylase UbiE